MNTKSLITEASAVPEAARKELLNRTANGSFASDHRDSDLGKIYVEVAKRHGVTFDALRQSFYGQPVGVR